MTREPKPATDRPEPSYDDLRALAHTLLRGQQPGQTLRTTALVHEAYLRLADREDFESESHFYGVAARAMRHALIDYARARKAEKRGGGATPIDIYEIAAAIGSGPGHEPIGLLELDDALERLADLDERKARVIELRFFGGLDIARTADVLGVGHATIERDWAFARAWLRRELTGQR